MAFYKPSKTHRHYKKIRAGTEMYSSSKLAVALVSCGFWSVFSFVVRKVLKLQPRES